MNERVLRDREAYENLPVAVFIANARGELEWVNSHWYRATGVTPSETLGEAWALMVHPDDIEELVWRWTRAIDTGAPFVAMARTRYANDTYRWHLSQARLVESDAGEPYWLGLSQDLSGVAFDRVALAEADKRADREASEAKSAVAVREGDRLRDR